MIVIQSDIFYGFCYIVAEIHENCYNSFQGCCGQSVAKAGIWYNMGKIMKRKILVVEDVEADALAAKDDLEEGNFEVDIARSANEGLGKLLLNQYALAIVDLRLSANGSFADGMDLIKKAKASNVATPFAIFSNMTDTKSIVKCYEELGIKTFIKKFYDRGELLVRVKSILGDGDAQNESAAVVNIGPVTYDKVNMVVTKNGKKIDIGKRHLLIFNLLVHHLHGFVTTDMINEVAFGGSATNQTISQRISELRDCLKDETTGEPFPIHFKSGKGYEIQY